MLAVIKKERVVIASPKRATFRVRTDTRGVGVGIKKPPEASAECISGDGDYKPRIGVEKRRNF
jgi:hypothetical protein